MSPLHQFLLTILITQICSAQVPVSITGESTFKILSNCIQDCLVRTGGGAVDDKLGCYFSFYNECYCRPDQQSKANTFISSCVSSRCGPPATVDISLGVSVYNNYCSTALDPVPAAGQTSSEAAASPPVVTEIDTSVVRMTATVIQSIEVTAIVTNTVVDSTTIVTGATITRITGTRITRIPTSVTELIYSTFTSILNDTSAAQLAAEWTRSQRLSQGPKIAIAVGIGDPVVGGIQDSSRRVEMTRNCGFDIFKWV
ncbi:hypothetical protein H072_7644 [Dactylellina haptotyla CBS 200.50]|uniref:Extracellular membrane protein CFEM domain-containing protein n=1 Tax=Dactylellina haptotyla (strain CBS 200.50) TaxID=1284197 RepID=S8BTM6_DACHA|nr:hypothetical protein H072_7644 [Dactylellina haptotyla CBS 200.50]